MEDEGRFATSLLVKNEAHRAVAIHAAWGIVSLRALLTGAGMGDAGALLPGRARRQLRQTAFRESFQSLAGRAPRPPRIGICTPIRDRTRPDKDKRQKGARGRGKFPRLVKSEALVAAAIQAAVRFPETSKQAEKLSGSRLPRFSRNDESNHHYKA